MDDRIMILELNHFANLCGHFFNVCRTDPELPSINNGYNCAHPGQEETVEKCGKVIGCCYGWSCPLGYPPSEYDLVKYAVVEDSGDCDEDTSDYDYIIVTDTATIRRLREQGVVGFAGRTMREAEHWEADCNETVAQDQ